MTTTRLTAQHQRAFGALTSGKHANFAMCRVFVNNRPAATIVPVTAHEPRNEGCDIEIHI